MEKKDLQSFFGLKTVLILKDFEKFSEILFDISLRFTLNIILNFGIYLVFSFCYYLHKIYVIYIREKVLKSFPTVRFTENYEPEPEPGLESESESEPKSEPESESKPESKQEVNDQFQETHQTEDSNDSNEKDLAIKQHIEHEEISNCPDCVICLTPIEVGTQLLCTHVFHKSCLDEMTAESASFKCPICGFDNLMNKGNFSEMKRKFPFHLQNLLGGVSAKELKKTKFKKTWFDQIEDLENYTLSDVYEEDPIFSNLDNTYLDFKRVYKPRKRLIRGGRHNFRMRIQDIHYKESLLFKKPREVCLVTQWKLAQYKS